MRVISQDGAIDVPYELTAIQLVGKTTVVAQSSYFGCGNDNFATIAEYLTEEKAQKAMKMLHENYIGIDESSYRDKYGGVLYHGRKENETKIFQFPKDEDVECK